jgi:fibronectin type 3 domain-containing protein
MKASTKSKTLLRIFLAALVLAIAWIGFQLGTHRHTGILRVLTQGKHFLSNAVTAARAEQPRASASTGPQHSVSLSWKPSSSAGVGYNVYRRGTSGELVRLNAAPIDETSYIDRTVQSGQTYFYVTKAVNAKGAESSPSNEVPVTVPSP